MHKHYPVESILALTFTNKAVSEMYSRIYSLLAVEREDPWAAKAVEQFHRARISTLDSFCAAVARSAARYYGIGADFKSDNEAVREMVLDAALPFVLNHRDNPALQFLMAEQKIKTVAEELFAEAVLRYSPISKPLDFRCFMELQGREILAVWERGLENTAACIAAIQETVAGLAGTGDNLCAALLAAMGPRESIPEPPEIAPLLETAGLLAGRGKDDNATTANCSTEKLTALRHSITAWFIWLWGIVSINLRLGSKTSAAPIREKIRELKDLHYKQLEGAANLALQADIIAGIFPLVDEFQKLCARQKREAGILTFQDIACLAVDALRDHPEIRRTYKQELQAIMIDEFQDNNILQRDLIFLLAEQEERNETGNPIPEKELSTAKLFFVGDEKQSIYRFRGADVSVFRGLADIFGQGLGVNLALRYNYRSSPGLITAFNCIFGGGTGDVPGVFPPDGAPVEPFEARYIPALAPGEAGDSNAVNSNTVDPPVYFCFLDQGRIDQNDPRALSAPELEAAFIAGEIQRLVKSGFLIRCREQGEEHTRPCGYGDFAILQRSYTHQQKLEKQLTALGIPYTAARPAALFSDAPINDLYHYLRLLAYPEDHIAYAAVLRSPFVRLSDISLVACLLGSSGAMPFEESVETLLPGEERGRYRRARERYQILSAEAAELTTAELITRLWYREGYRYETLWSEAAQSFAPLFELFFEMARKADSRGKTLTGFLDYLEDLMNRDERLDDLSVPSESPGGVKLMSIHACKGLEFPIVFVYNCAASGGNTGSTKTVAFSELWGITIKLPRTDELPANGSGSGNFFFKLQEEEEKRKKEAELRRLLYVAMTRAENLLYITTSLEGRTQKEQQTAGDEDTAYTDAFILKRLEELCQKERKNNDRFIDFLLPVIIPRAGTPRRGESCPYAIRHIPAGIPAAPLRLTLGKATARSCYEDASLVETPEPLPPTVAASTCDPAEPGPDTLDTGQDSRPDPAEDSIDSILVKAGLDAAGFGTLAHSYIEARFKGDEVHIPHRIQAQLADREGAQDAVKAAAEALADRFFQSELGALSLGADWRESEFPLITRMEGLLITGQIDLLFEERGTIHVVDFKTDRLVKAEQHQAQLAVYRQAAKDLFGGDGHKPVRSWLFYLRQGRALEMGC
jgi:ATP-dependent helicase/nuclease subunit A